jgi:hypothetical protein
VEGFSKPQFTERTARLLPTRPPQGRPNRPLQAGPPGHHPDRHLHSRPAKSLLCQAFASRPTRPLLPGHLTKSLPGATPQTLRPFPISLQGRSPAIWLYASPPGHHPPTSLPAHQAAVPQAHQTPLPPTTGGLEHHQMPAQKLPKRHIQTGLDAKGVTPEQLRL